MNPINKEVLKNSYCFEKICDETVNLLFMKNDFFILQHHRMIKLLKEIERFKQYEKGRKGDFECFDCVDVKSMFLLVDLDGTYNKTNIYDSLQFIIISFYYKMCYICLQKHIKIICPFFNNYQGLHYNN